MSGRQEPAVAVDKREVERLDAVRRWRVLDVPPDCFQQVAAVAARVFGVPYAVVSVVDTERVWFKARHGLDADSVARGPGLCGAVVETGRPLVLPDARLDPASLANPLVAGGLRLRFYAGAPLRTSDGYDLGALAVFDTLTRDVAAGEEATLVDLAGLVVRELEVRLSARVEVSAEQEEADLARVKADNLDATLGTYGTIGQAMGILMAQRGYPSVVAFDALRTVSQRRNVKLAEVARRLVDDFDQRAHRQPSAAAL
jgi:GAF domain-containing protein